MTEAQQPPEPTLDQDGRVILTGISSRAFEHPADRTALTAMRAVPGFDQLLRVASGMLRERQYRLVYLSSAVRVDERQFADLHALLNEVCVILDAPDRPELYVFNDPKPNAITLGVDKPFIAMSSGLYELTDEDERRYVLGHELGHAMSGHALYQSMLLHLVNLIGAIGWIPVGGFGLRAFYSALREWQRKAEFTGDRAGLLATQDLDVALRVTMKLAGGAHLDRIDVTAFLKQADDYQGAGDLRDGVLKLLNTERTSHPFAVVRAGEINRWAAGDEYRDILAGHYPRRSDDQTASFSDSARDAARSYKKRIDESSDPLVGALRGFGSSVGTAADSVFDWLSRRARGGVQETTEPTEPTAETPAPEQPDEQSGGGGTPPDPSP
ncbi:MAG TPA: M48 family metallopeptidase [Jatrophihabitans sp.]|nr:M48 family metallopeptidase [Jatrophihabitans sp.]